VSWERVSLIFELEVIVRNVWLCDFILGNIDHSDATTTAWITEDGKFDSLLNEVNELFTSHIWSVLVVNITIKVRATRSTHSVVSRVLVTSLVDLIDLKAFIRVPAGANHRDGKSRIIVDDVFHAVSDRLDGRVSTEFKCLDVSVVSQVLGNSLGVWRGSSSLHVHASVNGFEFIWSFISNVHAL
jgi:hypothetical protein